jgi:hypothetical protein
MRMYASNLCHDQVGAFPCGTCGRPTTEGNCMVTVTSSHGVLKISSKCPEFTGITYGSALKGSKTTPCTNVPVVCELCIRSNNSNSTCGIWRYNMDAHIKNLHPGHMDSSQFSAKFLQLITILPAEESAMGIPQEQIPTTALTTPNPSNEVIIQNSPCGLKRRALEGIPSPTPKRTKRVYPAP